MEIYEPAEDSFLLQQTVKDYLINLVNKNNINNITNNVSKNKLKQSSLNKYSLVHNCNHSNIKILDMGSGSGIQIKTCKELGFKNILAVDINKDAVKELKKQKIPSINSDLFSELNNEKFDLIIFNPPYLPDDKLESIDSKLSTTAGKYGYELILKFLKQAKNHLNKKGVILLLFSSLSKPNIIKKQGRLLGYNFKLINKQKIFFEELFVYKIYLLG